MCNAYICINRGTYRLIVMSQRDENLDRLTKGAHWRNGMLGGMDLEDPAKGTWFAVDKSGRAGFLLSITQPRETKMLNAPSRGSIVDNYLLSSDSLSSYTHSLLPSATDYNGFQFVGLEPSSEGYRMETLTNLFVDEIGIQQWREGTYVLGNSPPDKPFKKVLRAEELFKESLEDIDNLTTDDEVAERLIKVAQDKVQCCPDEQLDVQLGRKTHLNDHMSQINIQFPSEENVRYGTRCFTVFLVDQNGKAFFLERRLMGDTPDPFYPIWEDVVYRFNIETTSQ